ncbi:phenoloxidase-activating factor 3-like [Uranotaenia lowii]|uniref:phenoloxidase-activating factor 3-like n=1 Tax=Uranotaenia lowii TaxID=190385 RepID=UPI0024787EB3|nr:phenoloxidase-activating factor 3-like [Uranotaenia lowii]
MAASCARTTALGCVALTALLIVAPWTVWAASCETENYEPGVCVSLAKCETFSTAFAAGSLSSGQRALLQKEQEKCPSESGLVCCKRKLRAEIPRTFVDRKPMTRGMSDLLPDQTVCGLDSSDRIFYGNLTKLDQFPWVAIIKYINADEVESFECGGSLINKRYILTAAHCINNRTAGVRLGEWDLESDPDCDKASKQCADPPIDVDIEKILIHKNYTRRVSKGGKIDMALIRLNRDVSFGKYVAPICLPKTAEEAELTENETLYVAGWGLTENYTRSTKKLFVDVNKVSQEECIQKIKAPLVKIDHTIICALGVGGKDSCQGDSGGPLMEIRQGSSSYLRYFLKGVVAKGLACGTSKPGFYTNVHEQIDWIVSNMEP